MVCLVRAQLTQPIAGVEGICHVRVRRGYGSQAARDTLSEVGSGGRAGRWLSCVR